MLSVINKVGVIGWGNMGEAWASQGSVPGA